MYSLSDEQIDYILHDIRARGIRMESLQQDLLDHVCCIIERELEAEGDFERLYASVMARFYRQQLSEIEEETHLLLTFNNFYKMKKVMMMSGAYTAIAFIAGALFKLMHWPGAIIFPVTGIPMLCLVFLPLLLVLKMKEIRSRRDKMMLFMGTALAILYSISALLLVMRWQFAHEIWLFTLGVSFLVFIPAYFFTGIRLPETKVNTIVTTILLVAITGIQFTLTSLRPPLPQAQPGTAAVVPRQPAK